MTPKFYGKAVAGKLKLQGAFDFKAYLTTLEDKEIEVTVKKFKKNRTIRQNSFYWAYLHIIETETGQEAKEIHEIAKRLFLPPRFKTVFGKEYKLPATTRTLPRDRFIIYMDRIEQWTGVPIPNPDDYYYG